MKKKITLLSGIILLSFFMVSTVVGQETTQDKKKEAKAKTEMDKKDVTSKCSTCPTLSGCTSETAVKAKATSVKTGDANVEKAVTNTSKKKVIK